MRHCYSNILIKEKYNIKIYIKKNFKGKSKQIQILYLKIVYRKIETLYEIEHYSYSLIQILLKFLNTDYNSSKIDFSR